MEHIKIHEKDQKIIEEKFKCYVKVAFPKADAELKTKQILDFFYKHQTEILKKAKKLSKNCSTKNEGGHKTRYKTRSKYKYKSRSKTGGNFIDLFFEIAVITVGMMAVAAARGYWLLHNPSDDNLEVGTEEQHPHDHAYDTRPRNRIVATPRNRIVATPRNRMVTTPRNRTRQSQQGTSFDLYNRRYHNSEEDY